MIARVAKNFGGYSVFAGVGERTREGNDLWREMKEAEYTDAEGQEGPRARQGRDGVRPDERAAGRTSPRRPLGLTMAEEFRDASGKETMMFVDNVFRFTQAGSEVSALLGRMPSAVGYQPTLSTEMGELQERITSTAKGAITSVQAIYVPADDLTDPAPATAFAHLDAFVVLSPRIAEKGIYPAVDPLASTSRILDPQHHRRAPLPRRPARAGHPAALQGPPGHHRHPRRRRTVRRGQAHRQPRPQDRAIPLAALPRRRAVHRLQGRRLQLERRSTPSSASATARATTCPSPRSCTSAPLDDAHTLGTVSVPFPVRMVGTLVFKPLLGRSRMRPGIKLPKKATPMLPRDQVPFEEGLAALRKQMARVEAGEKMTHPSPVLGRMTHEQWVILHLDHCRMHMGFIRKA
jgi:hypothetical protein